MEKLDIILIQPRCGKYDMFIMDMPLGLLYISRLLLSNGYNVHIVDQRVENNIFKRIDELLLLDPLWIGVTVMTGEPIQHALKLSRYIKNKSTVPIVWGGIHPTILPEQTIQNRYIDYLVRGKGERSALCLSEYLRDTRPIQEVPGLTYLHNGKILNNIEDNDADWDEMPLVDYDIIDVKKYWRVGFEKKIFSIMTSRNCPFKCTFCYNSSLKDTSPWRPDSIEYTKKHIDYILEKHKPEYLSFIDDDFFVDIKRAREILEYLDGRAPTMKVGFRGARVSDLLKLDDDFFNLLDRINTRHINIGVESGSLQILKRIRKSITPEMAIELNKRLAKRDSLIPLYNFFSGIPQETEEDIKKSTELILQLVKENPNCQISGYHQYTPYPGNKLFNEAVAAGFPEPTSVEGWAELRFEDNAQNCPWIDRKRSRLLNVIYCMIYFVDDKYDTYLAKNNYIFRLLLPFVRLYKYIAKFRLKYHITVFPVEVLVKNFIYGIYERKKAVEEIGSKK